MRVLVTGGAGYVGSHAAKLLVASGHDVLIVDNLAEGHRPAVGNLPFVQADLLDRSRIAAVLAEHNIGALIVSSDGSSLEYLGRKEDQVKVDGHRLVLGDRVGGTSNSAGGDVRPGAARSAAGSAPTPALRPLPAHGPAGRWCCATKPPPGAGAMPQRSPAHGVAAGMAP